MERECTTAMSVNHFRQTHTHMCSGNAHKTFLYTFPFKHDRDRRGRQIATISEGTYNRTMRQHTIYHRCHPRCESRQSGREGGRQARLSQQTSSVSLSEGLVVRGRAKASSGRAAISKLALTQLPRGATLLSFCGEDFKQRKKTGGDCIVGINNNGYKSAGSDNLEKVPSVRPVTKCPSLAL